MRQVAVLSAAAQNGTPNFAVTSQNIWVPVCMAGCGSGKTPTFPTSTDTANKRWS